MGKVNISLTNGALGGGITTNDSVSALLLTGGGSGALALNTPIKVNSLPDAISQGITETDEPFAYQHVSEFYSEAPAGTELWLMIMAASVTMQSMLDKTQSNSAKTLIDASNGRVRLFGAVRNPATDYVPADYGDTPYAIDSDCSLAITHGQTLVNYYFGKEAPITCLIGAMVYDITQSTLAATLPNANVPANTGQVCGFVVGGTTNNGIASVGLALGRLAANTVQRNLGAVEDGSLNITDAYIGDFKTQGTAAKTVQQMLNNSTLDTYVNAGYITLYAYMQKAGFYWSDDPTATGPTDDYNSVAHVRVINKVAIVAYQTYINKVNTDVLVNSDGTINAGAAKSLEGLIDNAVNTALKIPKDPSSAGSDAEASAFASSIDLTQNVVTNNQVSIVCKVTPKGYLKTIDVLLGFAL